MTKRQTPAQLIKAELKKAFPWVNFSCRYSSFSGWDAVDVSRKWWPLTRDVDRIASQYEAWHFDWMTDMYEYTNDRPCYETAKYVMCYRDDDPEQTEQFIADAGYTKDQLKWFVSDLSWYDAQRGIASIVYHKMEDLTNNHWDNYSHELNMKNEEIGQIVARYVVYNS